MDIRTLNGRRIPTALLALWLLAFSPVLQAALTTSVDRNPLPPDSPVVLTVELEGSSEEPDFSVLDKQFQILSSRSGTNISVVNGDARRIRNWEFSLLPRPGSNGLIPALSAGSFRSQPIQLQFSNDPALAAQSAQVASLTMELSHASGPVHVGEQLILDVRLRVQPGLANTRLNPPTAAGAVLEPLGKAQESTEVVQGIRYEVYSWRYAVFPEQSGQLTIQPPVFQAEQLSRRGSRNPFGSTLFGGARTPVLARAQAKTLQIEAVPPGGDGPFLPARAVTLQEQILPEGAPARVGEPLTRVIELRVDGQLHSQLEPLDVAPPLGARSYPEAPQGESLAAQQGVQSRQTSRWVVIPEGIGGLTLPGITVRWWDTEADQWREASLPERRLEVRGAAAPSQPLAATVTDAAAEPLPVAQAEGPFWRGLSLALLLLWLGTLVAWWHAHGRDRKTPEALEAPAEVAESEARSEALRLLKSGAETPAVHEAMRRWADSYWQASDQPGTASLQRLAHWLASDPLAEQLRSLDRARYGRDTDWDPIRTHQALQDLPVPRRRTAATAGLPPLYPQHPAQSS